MSRKCAVYMMVSDAPIWPDKAKGDGYSVFKIGISEAPQSRLHSIRTASPFSIVMPWVWWLPTKDLALKIERLFHAANALERLTGEWFYGCLTGAACEIDHTIAQYGAITLELPRAQVEGLLRGAGLTPEHASDVVTEGFGEGDW